MSDAFRFDYRPGTIAYGAGVTSTLGAELARRDRSRALVVCGSTVGSTEAVIGPVRDGLGERLAGVFDRTTPTKSIATAVAGAERVADVDADALVGLGGGSSLDVAKLIAVLAGHHRPAAEVAREAVAEGRVDVPGGDLLPIVAVPTTLAGADLSVVAGTRLVGPDGSGDRGNAASTGVSDGRLMPTAAVYDPDLFATTPTSILAASAMNGFDKGIEMVYARDHTPVTDATATHGLRLLRRGLPAVGPGGGAGEDGGGSDAAVGAGDATSDVDDGRLADVVRGIVLVQYGLSSESTYRASLIHAFGHAVSRPYDVTQGVVHAILAPHVLRYLFDAVDGRRATLARGFDVDPDAGPDATAEAIVDEVVRVRDALGLPARLRSIDGLERAALPSIAEAVLADGFVANVPPALDPDAPAIEAVLDDAW